MDDGEADKRAIMAVLAAETEAWARRDFAALAEHWVHSPQTRHLAAFPSAGTWVDEGWDAVAARLRAIMERHPRAHDITQRLRRDNVNVVVVGDMAWCSYDQIATDIGDDLDIAGLQHKVDVLQRIEGTWKIGCQVLMQTTVDQSPSPLIEVDAEMRVLWMNPAAPARIRDHPGLLVAAGRLRARQRRYETGLREAVAWAHRELAGVVSYRTAPEQARAVPLGEDDASTPLHCWMIIKDGKALVSLDDTQAVERRIASAREVYRLSPAQVRLARLIVDGHDLTTAASLLGVSVNTLRTQLQRMFDKTGTRSQPALVRILLNTRPPSR